MTIRHRAALVLLTLAALPALTLCAQAQTVEGAPTNCCTEVYWVGWEVGQLRSIASYAAAHEQAASLHMERLGATLEAANATCCHFCEAWAEWPQIRDGIRTTATELLDSPESGAVETRRVFRDWVESRPADLIRGLNRCDLEDEMPCKWLGLVECARAYLQLGERLGYATHALSAAEEGAEGGLVPIRNARQEGVESLAAAARLLASLGAAADPGAPGPGLHCDYLWSSETGVERLLSEAVRQPEVRTTAQLAAAASKANRLVLGLLLDGRPDLGIDPCPIGGTHDHAQCEREQTAQKEADP